MDIGKDFTDSFHSLVQNKVVILPVFIASMIFTIAILAVLWSSGIFDDFSQYSALREQYIKESGAANNKQIDEKKFEGYLESKGFVWNNLRQFINLRNGILIGVLALFLIIFSFYMRCASLSLITLVVKKKKVDYGKMLSLAGKYFFRLAWLHVLLVLIFIVPLTIGILGIVLSFFISRVLGILSIMLVVLAMIAYSVFIFIKLIFALPISFLDDETAFQSVKNAYEITKGRFLDTFLVFAVFVGIAMAFSFLSSIIFNFLPLVLLLGKGAIIVIILLVLLLYYFLNSIIDAFMHLFLFYAYADFKKGVNVKKGR